VVVGGPARSGSRPSRRSDRSHSEVPLLAGLTRRQFLLPLLAATASCQPTNDLALELQQRSASEGLALLRIRNNWVGVLVGGKVPTRNPRGNSLAWFSANGNFVAWLILNLPDVVYPCPGSIAVTRRDGELLWQLPGGFRGGENLTQTLGLSQDGRRVALVAGNVSGPDAPRQPGRALSLQWIDMADRKIVLIGEPSRDDDIGSISWAPDGNSFVFDRAGKVFIYDLASQRSLAVAEGRDPTWSPDGKQIAFRTGGGKAAALDPTTLKQRELLGGRKILSAVQWSPDSRYVVATEPASLGDKVSHGDPTISAITSVYRLSDMSSVTLDAPNIDSLDDRGRWWFWILDYSGFLRGAQAELPLRCGQH
jgi:WD40-like Beta Propeller Repeat